jgi:hypothetical protein
MFTGLVPDVPLYLGKSIRRRSIERRKSHE